MRVRTTDGEVIDVGDTGRNVAPDHTELIALRADAVRACLDRAAPVLARAVAIAALTPGQFSKLFGPSRDGRGRYRQARRLFTIGRALSPDALPGLVGSSVWDLVAAARFRDPEAQIAAAVAARAERLAQRIARNAPRYPTSTHPDDAETADRR